MEDGLITWGGYLEYFANAEIYENDINIAKEYWDKMKAGNAISWYIVNKGYDIDNK